MKPFHTSILVLLAFILGVYTQPFLSQTKEKSRIVKVDYSRVSTLLENYVLKRPENKELAIKYASALNDRSLHFFNENQSKQDKPYHVSKRLGPPELTKDELENPRWNDIKQVKSLAEDHLMFLINHKYKDDYEVIFKNNNTTNILYSQIKPDDITDEIYQELLKANDQ